MLGGGSAASGGLADSDYTAPGSVVAPGRASLLGSCTQLDVASLIGSSNTFLTAHLRPREWARPLMDQSAWLWLVSRCRARQHVGDTEARHRGQPRAVDAVDPLVDRLRIEAGR